MLEIIAFAKQSGWAFVREKDGIQLVRPPYVQALSHPVDKYTVEKSVGLHGFSSFHKEFESWKQLIGFLNQQVKLYRKSQQKEIDKDIGSEFLKVAPTEDIVYFLDKIEKELIPARKWEHADKLLITMLRISSIKTNPDLIEKVASLLDMVSKGKSQQDADLLNFEVKQLKSKSISPLANKHYGEKNVSAFAKEIASRRQILCPV